jgi:alpha-1,3-mannosyltransferase
MATKEVDKSKSASAYRQLKDFAMGVHPLSKYASPLLLLVDALLTSAIIYKVSCKFSIALAQVNLID